ncbi:probable disease resistance protein At1g58602 isoform X1 [Salvia miltiorrhiza]|uniref:probable disease resistance protein At1g58602 isoform X1 n=1 Tax=Salvia miltiorrhiza TaxID=226208 RepID=UPI0025AD4A45|nr:probable disease resistance protein At1g58602 isoform X1 [Salvia miltiorrhiza]
MADAAVVSSVLIEQFSDSVCGYINQLTQGHYVVTRIRYELETLIPQLERIEAEPGLSIETEELIATIRDVIRKAEDLTETHTKREIQRDAATFKAPIYELKILRISKQLHGVNEDISRYRNQLSEQLRRELLVPGLAAAAAEEQSIPSYLRRCMRYLILFPPGFLVRTRRLIALWVAEGLVGEEFVEQTAENYLNELIALRVLLPTSRKRNGKVKVCKIDAGRREAMLQEAEKSNFLKDRNGKILRLVDDHNEAAESNGDSFIHIHGNPTISSSVQDYRDVISFLSFNSQEGTKPGEDIGDFLRRCISAGCFIWLRVLDLERVFRPKLTEALGKLIAIKYLGLRLTYLEKLPDSVNKLFNLHVLDVKHTYISFLPRSIWRMQYLRHLYLSEAYRTRFPDPPSQVTLTALQTLWGAFVDEDTPVVGGLDKLLNIRKLALSCRSRASKEDEMSRQLEAIKEWISNLKLLESLRLKSRDEDNEAADLKLTSLEGNPKLSSVYLLGKVHSTILRNLPTSLTNITLSGSKLDLDPFEVLGKLPNLVILGLLGQSVVCSTMYCSRKGFRRLKVLRIWKIENLEVYEEEEGSLPCLEVRDIRECDGLKTVPDPLRRVHNPEVERPSVPPEFMRESEGENAQNEDVTNVDGDTGGENDLQAMGENMGNPLVDTMEIVEEFVKEGENRYRASG